MSLSLRKSSGVKIADGAYASKVKILRVTDYSNVETPFGRTNDLALELELDIGRDFNPKLMISGNLKETPNGVEWGGAFVIRELFESTGILDSLNDNQIDDLEESLSNKIIPKEIVKKLIGKEFYQVQYFAGYKEDGKPKYYNLYRAFKDIETAKKAFDQQLKSGYLKNYKPDELDNPVQAEIPNEDENLPI